MTGTNNPEGHRRAFESLTKGDYGKLRDQRGIVADACLHGLRHYCVTHSGCLMSIGVEHWPLLQNWDLRT